MKAAISSADAPRERDDDMERLTPDQAHRVMRAFLERQLARSLAMDVARVLSDAQMLPDGRSTAQGAGRRMSAP